MIKTLLLLLNVCKCEIMVRFGNSLTHPLCLLFLSSKITFSHLKSLLVRAGCKSYLNDKVVHQLHFCRTGLMASSSPLIENLIVKGFPS